MVCSRSSNISRGKSTRKGKNRKAKSCIILVLCYGHIPMGGGQFATNWFIQKIKKKQLQMKNCIRQRVFSSLKCKESIKNGLEALQRLLRIEKSTAKVTYQEIDFFLKGMNNSN